MPRVNLDHKTLLLFGRCFDDILFSKRRRLMRYRAEVSWRRGKISHEEYRRTERWRGIHA